MSNLKSVRKLNLVILAGALNALCLGEDLELTNYRSGIDVFFSGEKGVDYMEEYFYHDKIVSDKKVVYIKEATKIHMTHNERNIAGNIQTAAHRNLWWEIGKDGLDGIPDSGDEGIIRFKVDRDLQLDYTVWADHQHGNANVPKYTGPFSLSDLEYEKGTPVVGTTGPKPGHIITDRGEYYERGMIDSVGDEWHIMYYADDDSQWVPAKEPRVNDEFWSSDGKSILFVVNPKTPCLTIRSTGNGQFYTTPPKAYFIPRIYDQTTYIEERSGGISIEIRDINGNNVFYQINNGPWKEALNPTLTHSDFNNGINELRYYYTGNKEHTKTRTIVRNPDFPSAAENHGEMTWGGEETWRKILTKLKKEPHASAYKIIRDNQFFSGHDTIESSVRLGKRANPSGAWQNAFVAKVEGVDYKAPDKEWTHAQYAKLALFDNPRLIDPIGHEISHTGLPIPSRELHYRGYYDSLPVYDALFGYDILMGIYRSDQHINGITPIEDYFIRDMLAAFVLEAMQWGGNWTGVERGGMWDTARRMTALCVAVGMPTYSTPYYGTSGFDGNSQIHPWTPYPDDSNTWKNIFLEETLPLNGFPNLAHRLGLYEYNLIDETGLWQDRPPYFGYPLMGKVLSYTGNFLGLNTDIYWERLDRAFARAFNGKLESNKFPNEAPYEEYFPEVINSNFPIASEAGLQKVEELHRNNTLDLHKRGIAAVIWYSPPVSITSDKPEAPSSLTTQEPK